MSTIGGGFLRINSRSGRATAYRAFTLIEMLVAMTILAFIVLILGQVFHSSTMAWELGIDKAKGQMNARAVLGLIARELSEGVASVGVALPNSDLVADDGLLRFITLAGSTDPTVSVDKRRVFRRVEYRLTNEELVRRERFLEPSGSALYGQWSMAEAVNTLLTNVTHFAAIRRSGDPGGGGPTAVQLDLRVGRQAGSSGVFAWSSGPDADPATLTDNLRSW